MAFTFLPNNDVSAHSAALLLIKTQLVAHGWVVQDSGDGEVSVGTDGLYGNGTDILTAASDGGAYLAGNIANRLSWWRIRSPQGEGGVELIFFHAYFNPGSDSFGAFMIPECVGTGVWPGADSKYYGVPPDGNLMVPWGTSSTTGAIIQNQGTTEFDGDGATARKLDMAFGDADEGYAWYAFTRHATRRWYRGWALDYVKLANRYPGDYGHVLWMTGAVTEFSMWTNHKGSARTVWGAFGGWNSTGDAGGNPSTFATTEGNSLVSEVNRERQGRLSHAIIDPTSCFNSSGNQGTDLGLNPYNGLADVWRGSCWYYRSSCPEVSTLRGAPRYSGVKGKSTLFHHGGGGVSNMAVATGQDLVAQGGGRVWVIWDDSIVPLDPGGATAEAAVSVNMHTYMDVSYAEMTVEPDHDLPVEVVWGDLQPTAISLPGAIMYYQGAFDDGTGGWVYWEAWGTPNLSPIPGITRPNYTGSLSSFHIVFTRS